MNVPLFCFVYSFQIEFSSVHSILLHVCSHGAGQHVGEKKERKV